MYNVHKLNNQYQLCCLPNTHRPGIRTAENRYYYSCMYSIDKQRICMIPLIPQSLLSEYPICMSNGSCSHSSKYLNVRPGLLQCHSYNVIIKLKYSVHSVEICFYFAHIVCVFVDSKRFLYERTSSPK